MTIQDNQAGGVKLEAKARDVVKWLLGSRLVGHEVTAVKAAETVKSLIDALAALPAAGAGEQVRDIEDTLSAFDVLKAAQTDIEPDIASVVYPHRSKLYAATFASPPIPSGGETEPVAWQSRVQKMVVTDAMVDRAIDAMFPILPGYPRTRVHDYINADPKAVMRAALTAALSEPSP